MNDLRIILATILMLGLRRCPRWLGIADDLESRPQLQPQGSEAKRQAADQLRTVAASVIRQRDRRDCRELADEMIDPKRGMNTNDR